MKSVEKMINRVEMTNFERKRWVDENYNGGGLKAIADFVRLNPEYRHGHLGDLNYEPLLNWLNAPKYKD